MRSLILIILAAWGAPGSLFAAPLLLSHNGIFGGNCNAPYCVAAGDTWAYSFELDSNPLPFNISADSFEVAISNFRFLRNNSEVAQLANSQTVARFYASTSVGGWTSPDGVYFLALSQSPLPRQLFQGSLAAPVFAVGDFGPISTTKVGGANQPGSPAPISITEPVPEPASGALIGILATGLLAFRFRRSSRFLS
jgi:hypothetical protein